MSSNKEFNGMLQPPALPATTVNLAAKAKKIPVSLVPPALVLGAARAFAEGAAKYGPYSWRKPEVKIEATTYAEAIMRHLFAWMDGEDLDPDSTTGKHHIEGIAATVGILLDVIASGTLIDNRPGKGPASGILRGVAVGGKIDDSKASGK